MGRVKKVDLYENGTIAIVEAVRCTCSPLPRRNCVQSTLLLP